MTQEIYNYLWIRSYILNMNIDMERDTIKNELANNSSETYKCFVVGLSNLMNEGDLLFTNYEKEKRALDLLNEFRYDYRSDKEINDAINNIICKVNEFHSLDYESRDRRMESFYSKEGIKRRLSLGDRHRYKYLNYLFKLDFINYIELFGEELEGSDKEPVMYDVKSICATVNLLISEYPRHFVLTDASDIILEYFKKAIDAIDRLDSEKAKKVNAKQILKYMNRTVKRMEKCKKQQTKYIKSLIKGYIN